MCSWHSWHQNPWAYAEEKRDLCENALAIRGEPFKSFMESMNWSPLISRLGMELGSIMACWQMFHLEPQGLKLSPPEGSLLEAFELMTRSGWLTYGHHYEAGEELIPPGITGHQDRTWMGGRLKLEPQKWVANGKRRVDFMLTYSDPNRPVAPYRLAVEADSYTWHFRTRRKALDHTRRIRDIMDDGLHIRPYMAEEIRDDPIWCAVDAVKAVKRGFESQLPSEEL